MLELGVKITLAYALGAIMGGLVVGYLHGGTTKEERRWIRRGGS